MASLSESKEIHLTTLSGTVEILVQYKPHVEILNTFNLRCNEVIYKLFLYWGNDVSWYMILVENGIL